MSTLAFLNLLINSGAVAGSSTLILCILLPNSGPIASTIADVRHRINQLF